MHCSTQTSTHNTVNSASKHSKDAACGVLQGDLYAASYMPLPA